MISIQRLNSRGGNSHNDLVIEYLMETEYYLDKGGRQADTMRWGGKLARELSLDGQEVTKERMSALAKGFAPDGTALCMNAGEEPQWVTKIDRRTGLPKLDEKRQEIKKLEGGHRVGFDLTYSAPKPFSLAFAIGLPEEKDALLDAHRQAVRVSMDYIESKVETRRGKAGKDVIETKGLIYSLHDHMANRNLEPNVHTHTLIYGVAQGSDGKWGTFDAQELYRHRMAADQIYKNELAMNLRDLGYGIEVYREKDIDQFETGRTFWSIAGISDELCDRFSSRRQEILAYQEAHGVSAQTACLATRKHKDEPSYPELVSMWSQTLASMDDGQVPTIEGIKQLAGKQVDVATQDVILERLHTSEAYVSDHQLIERLGMEHTGRLRFSDLQQVVSAFKTNAGMVRIDPELLHEEDRGQSLSKRHTEARYSAPWMVEWETEIVHRACARQNETHLQVPASIVQAAIDEYQLRKGITLSEEQHRAVRHITQVTAGVAVMSGLAGTGKTTIGDLYSAAFRANGRTMVGVAVSNAAAKKLEQESGMPSLSVAKTLDMLERGQLSLSKSHVLVLDEAGMVDTNQTRRMMGFCDRAGAKFILQGDQEQLQPIGAGSGMSLAKLAIGDTQLTEIRRQTHKEDRDIARLFYDQDETGQIITSKVQLSRHEGLAKGTSILHALDARGAIDDYDTQDQAIAALVNDHLMSPAPLASKLVLAHSRAEVSKLNQAIRSGLKRSGELTGADVTFRVRDGGQWIELAVSVGERIRFNARDDYLGVINGTQGQIASLSANRRGGFDVGVHLSDGERITFNTQDFNAITHNYAMTIHKAQGQGRSEVYHLANSSMLDNQSALVAFSRLTDGHYTLYGTTDDVDRLHERLGLDRLKSTALEQGIVGRCMADIRNQQASPQDRDQAHALTPADTQWIEANVSTLAGWSRALSTEGLARYNRSL